MGWLFQALFKYPAFVFEQGDFRFAMSRSGIAVLLVAAAVAGAALVTYRGLHQEGDRPRDRAVLIALRLGVIGILLFCLFRPLLVLKAAVPQQNFLGVLIDDSRSMTIADRGTPRTDFVNSQLAKADSPLLAALSKRFVIRPFRFSSSADRITGADGLKYEGTTSRIATALEQVRDELAGLPLAGLVVVTDGADTSEGTLDDALAGLKARSIPVFPIGVGEERFERDIEITRVETPRATLKGNSLSVDAVVRQTGFSGTAVKLNVEDDGRIVGSQDVVLPADGESATVRVTFTASDEGPRVFRFIITPLEGEQVTQNNARDALVEVANVQERILYFEGEPRYELAFVRREFQNDKNLQVTLLVRTAENKYWRGDVTSADELQGGFPTTREELFAYKAVILGSVEAASFSPDQLNMLAEFVSKRGGGLLMLGGRRAFSEGGWAGTPLAEALPVELVSKSPDSGAKAEVMHLSVRPTREGSIYPVIQLAANGDKSAAKWETMPTVTSVNPVTALRPGATKLLVGLDERRREQVVLAYQRYGRGKTLAFPIQDSWIWKMDVTIAVDDPTFGTFWRRMARWLVDGVPDPVTITTSRDRVDPGEPITLTANVADQAFVEVNDARVLAQVTAPSGRTLSVPLEWTVKQNGVYTGTFVPDEVGKYELRATASREETDLGTSLMHARVSAGDGEYFDASMRAPLLRRVAEDTGGRFFTAADVSALPEAISYSGRGVTVVEERDLWDMPVVFVLLFGLIAAEWLFRRNRGLA